MVLRLNSRLAERFVLDVHLGRLARHLRMLGFDAIELARVSNEEKRWLLSRDRALIESHGELGYYVNATDPREQLIEVVGRFELRERFKAFSRCLECNTEILPAKPHQVADRVPGGVMARFDQFYLCPRCERVYWEGSHFDRMQEWLKRVMS